MKKLLVLSSLSDVFLKEVSQIFPDVEVVDCSLCPGDIDFQIRDANYVFGKPRRDQFILAKCLEFIQVPTQGIESLLFEELINSSVLVSNAKGVWSPAIAEHVLSMILAFYRGLHIYAIYKEERKWVQRDILLDTLKGKTVCFVGTGDIAVHTIRLLKAFDCKITGVNRSGNKPEGFEYVVTRKQIERVIPFADVVIGSLPFTKETVRFFDCFVFELFKKNALFINVGRGKTVDEKALLNALLEKRIAGAGLDVFETEPLPPESPFWTIPNVIITPHIAGLDINQEQRLFQLLVENIKRIRAGELPLNLVDKRRGY